MTGRLILADGKVFEGEAFGSDGERAGLVVVRNGSTGYQEAVTGPSYLGRIVVFTNPVVGGAGADESVNESDRVCAEGIVARELSAGGGAGAAKGFGEFCESRQLLGLQGVRTRELARHLRDSGEQWGLIITGDADRGKCLKLLAELKKTTQPDPDRYRVSGEALVAPWRPGRDNRTVVVLDLGAGKGFYLLLKENEYFWRAFGHRMTAAEILDIAPGAVIVTNGPYEPDALSGLVGTLKELAGALPLFGIGLGCVLVAAALGVEPAKMKSGHHGVNYAVADTYVGGRCRITTQNHSYTLSESSLKKAGAQVLFRNVNDGSVEGFAARKKKACGILFDPDDLSLIDEMTG